MTLPGGRVVLGWWRDLARLAPRRLWFGHLILHHIEALVELSPGQRPLAPLADVLLAWLAHQGGAVPLVRLAHDLPQVSGLLPELLENLASRGLVRQENDTWQLTEAGRQPAAARPPAPANLYERRGFFFTDTRPPLFLALGLDAAQPLPPPSAWHFDLAALQASIREPDEWKVRHGFPREVLCLVPATGAAEDWRTVVVDRPMQALLVLVEAAEEQVLCFSVRSEGWALGHEPVLVLADGTARLLPLGADPGPEGWRHAWQVWCQQRSLPGADVEACRLEAIDHRLRVQAPSRLIERLRAARSDALKGEAWLLAGTGRVRPAAMIELVEG
jgi:hypothetical protein